MTFIPRNRTNWTPEMIQFLRDNFNTHTNRQLADQLGLRLTVTRNKCRELGLKHMELQYWTEEQVQFLKDNYHTTGDAEMARIFQSKWAKNKKWSKSQMVKKRKQLNLNLTKEEYDAIWSKHVKPGGRAYTILQNSSSIHLQDGYVASLIAWRNPELRKEVLKNPDLIEIKRKQIQLTRAIKEVRNA